MKLSVVALLTPFLYGLTVLLCFGQPASASVVPYMQFLPSYYSIMDRWYNYRDAHYPFSRDYWHELLLHASKAAEVAAAELRNAQARFPDMRPVIDDFVGAVHDAVDTAAKLRPPRNVEDASEEISRALDAVVERIKAEFPPLDRAPTHEERLHMANTVIMHAIPAVKDVLVKFGVDEEQAQIALEHIGRLSVQMVVITGDVREQHPVLFATVITAAVIAAIPEGWLLRWWLDLLGFGARGPVKNSAASWMQRNFYGAVVEENSWFSALERAGMTVRKAPGCFGLM